MDDKLPPISLQITAERVGLRARLRLSGSESIGSASLNGRELRVTFGDGRATMVAEVVSRTQLRLRLQATGPEYRLTKRP